MKTHDLKLGFRFHAPTGELRIRMTPSGLVLLPPRWYAELLKMERDAREFEAQLQEIPRVANMGRSELEEMARKAREVGEGHGEEGAQ